MLLGAFSQDTYTNLAKFSKEVRQYQADISEDPSSWKPDEVAFNLSELQIQYMAWLTGSDDLLENECLIEDDEDAFDEEADEGGYQVEVIAKLKADNGKFFTAAEFLMKAHNQQANKELGNHVFFEGTDYEPMMVNGLPTYPIIACGS